MNFNVSADTLANVVTMLLVNTERSGELDSQERYSAFVKDLTALVCDHCGGEVVEVVTEAANTVVSVQANDSLPEDGGIWAKVAPLLPFRVLLLEDREATIPIFYECMAVDFEHALDQTRDAYPECQVLCDDVGQEGAWSTFYVIFSPSQFAKDSFSGFWSSDHGWTNITKASLYLAPYLRDVAIPMQVGEKQDAMLSRLETAAHMANAICFA